MSFKPLTILFWVLSLSLWVSDAAASCSPLASVPVAVEATRVIVFGELHGTRESPEFVGRFLCTASHQGQRVVLALEIPVEEQARIDAFLASDGDVLDVQRLLSGEFWTRSTHDGRSSTAMLDLIKTARKMREAGAEVSILAFARYDDRPGDAAMAEVIASVLDADSMLHAVVLVGNAHSDKSSDARWDAGSRTLGHHLAERFDTLAFRMKSAGGSFWACVSGRCGVHERNGAVPLVLAPGVLALEGGSSAHDGYYFVGTTSASPPPHHPPLEGGWPPASIQW